MNDEKEALRHRKMMEWIKNANSREELPNISLSSIASYLSNNAYFDNKRLSQTLFKPVVDLLASYNLFSMPQVKEVFISILRENYPGRREEEYLEKYNMIAKSSKITNILIEVGEKNYRLQQFQNKEDLKKHNITMYQIKQAYDIDKLPGVFISDLNKRIQRDFNGNDFIRNIKVSSIRNISNAYMNECDFKEIDSLVHDFCSKQSIDKDNRELMYSQIRSNLLLDRKIKYLVSELKEIEKRKLEIYKSKHDLTMKYIQNASTLRDLPPNCTFSCLTTYLANNSVIFVNGDKVSTLDLKGVTALLLKGKKWEDNDIKKELWDICSKYYSDKVDVAFKILYDKFKDLPKTYYMVEEIVESNKKISEFTKNGCSNVNLYLHLDSNSPVNGGSFYKCYIHRGIEKIDMKNIIPNNLEDIVPPEISGDSIEWFMQEYYNMSFKPVGGIILKKDETIGSVNIFSPNDDFSISNGDSSAEKLRLLCEKASDLFQKRDDEQAQMLRILSSFLSSQQKMDNQLNELKKEIDSLNSDVQKNYSRKKEK